MHTLLDSKANVMRDSTRARFFFPMEGFAAAGGGQGFSRGRECQPHVGQRDGSACVTSSRLRRDRWRRRYRREHHHQLDFSSRLRVDGYVPNKALTRFGRAPERGRGRICVTSFRQVLLRNCARPFGAT